VNFPKKQQFSLDENFVSLNENLNFKLFNRLTFDVYFDMRMAFGHALLDWRDTNKSFGLSVVNHRCILNMETTTLGFRRAFLFLTQAISSYRRSNILFVSGLPAHDNFQDFLKFHQNNLPLLGHGYMLHWVAGLLTNLGTLIETFWGKAKTVVSRFQKQNKRDWFLEAAKGMRMFQRFPDFIVFFSVSGIYEIAIKEASLLKIPTIAFVDSNCEVNNIPFSIPGNDDSVFGLELKIFLFRELILRTMKFRLFTEIDKLLLEGRSLQQLMVDSFMEEFVKEISENYKNKIKKNDKSSLLFSSPIKLKNKVTKTFLRFFFYFQSLFLLKHTQNRVCYNFVMFGFFKSIFVFYNFQCQFTRIGCFTPLRKQKLKTNKYYLFYNNNLNKKGSISKFNKYKILYKILYFCFKNSLKISGKKLNFLLNCFYCEQANGFAFKLNPQFILVTISNICATSMLFSFFYFNRCIFNFLSNLKSLAVNFFLCDFKPFSFAVFSAFKMLKNSQSNAVLSKKFAMKKIKKKALNFLQISAIFKKNVFLKSFVFWKIKKLHFKSRSKLQTLFHHYKHRAFSFLKYSQLLKFFPFLRSFFYKKFKRSKFSKHPTSAFNICVFFLPKHLFFRRKWYLKSPPFLFKRYSKFLKIKTAIHATFPKIFPSFYNKKKFNVTLYKTKMLYKEKICFFFKTKKKHIQKFVKDNFKTQKNNLIKAVKVLRVWKFFFFLSKKNSVHSLKFFLLNLKKIYFFVFRSFFQKTKRSLRLSCKEMFKKINLSFAFSLVYYELYFLIRAGIFSIVSLNNFIFARFLCFSKVFCNFKLQHHFLNVVLQLPKKLGSGLGSNVFFEGLVNKRFLLSFFKRVKTTKLFFAKTLNGVTVFLDYLQNFLFDVHVAFKKLKSDVSAAIIFSKNLFLRFLKILLVNVKRISSSKQYVGLSAFLAKDNGNLKKNKETQLLYFNKKFKQARNFYFLNFSKNVSVITPNVSKKHLNFLKLFVPSN